MAIGLALGAKALGAVSGLFGGGGPRAPRMSRCQKQQIQCQPQAHVGCARHMQNGCHRVNAASSVFCGRPCNSNFGPLANRGMCSAGAFAYSNSWSNGNMNNLFSPNYGNSFGHGPNFNTQNTSIAFAMGVNINV